MTRGICRVVWAFALCLLSADCGDESGLNEAQIRLKAVQQANEAARKEIERVGAENRALTTALQAASAEFVAVAKDRDATQLQVNRLEHELTLKDARTVELSAKITELETEVKRLREKASDAGVKP